MSHDNVFALRNPAVPNEVGNALTEVLREGARTLLAQAIEAEVAEFLAEHAEKRDAAGRTRLVRNGHLPERTVQTGIGAVTVKAPRVRDRAGQLRFASSILPPYLRRTKTLDELLPWLYLKGISTGGFAEALAALLGRDTPGLSAGTISRLKAVWQEEHAQWEERSLVHKRYVYLWVDGIHFGVRMEGANQCILAALPPGRESSRRSNAAVTYRSRPVHQFPPANDCCRRTLIPSTTSANVRFQSGPVVRPENRHALLWVGT